MVRKLIGIFIVLFAVFSCVHAGEKAPDFLEAFNLLRALIALGG